MIVIYVVAFFIAIIVGPFILLIPFILLGAWMDIPRCPDCKRKDQIVHYPGGGNEWARLECPFCGNHYSQW